MAELWRLEARDLARRIAARELSPVEVMRAALERVDAVNGAVNAIVSLRDREALMGEARLAEAMPPRGWLHGIPVAIKDLTETKGIRTSHGSPIFGRHVPSTDAGLVTRMKRAGAIVIGKTNVPEFGLGSHTRNPVFGPTRNPFDHSLTAGGSSGGAAAALATGMVSVADGSDMMGSLRNPAAWCNVYGFRPTPGLVPKDRGAAPFAHVLSTTGPMARSVGDLAQLLETLSDGGCTAAALRPDERPRRVAWLGDWDGAYVMATDLRGAGATAVARMADLGWEVDEIAPPIPAETLWEAWTTLRSFLVAQEHAAHWANAEEGALLNAQTRWEIERGMALTGAEIARATAQRAAWLACAAGLFERFDALILPSTQIWPFPVDWDWPTEIAGRAMDTYHRWMEITVPASLAGLPALNLPVGRNAAGLPHGLQLIGSEGSDAAILSMGLSWEMMVGPRQVVDPVR